MAGPSSQANETGPAAKEPTISEIRTWEADMLLEWIQQRLSVPLKPADSRKFLDAEIEGEAFLNGDRDFFIAAGFPFGIGQKLADLAKKTISKKRPRSEEELDGRRPVQKHQRLTLLQGSDSVYETGSDVDCKHLLFPAHAQFSTFWNDPGTIIADKTRFIRLLEASPFQYMFLRPRRWGKSTFLNMLATYYDVKTKDTFEDIFGSLDIGKAPTASRNSHLILLFDFSSINPTGPRDGVELSISKNIIKSLDDFLHRYQEILGIASPEEYIIPNDIATSLKNVLDLIYRCGYTAFVGVDEYDAPANICLMSALAKRDRLSAAEEEIFLLETVLKVEFFSVIKLFCGTSVAKYWITGVLPAFRDGISPLVATQVISFDKQYQSLCGFTQKDVDAIIARAMRDSPGYQREDVLRSIKFFYNGYNFNRSVSGTEISTLYNPQLVFVHLQKVISGSTRMPHIEESNAIHSATVLSAMVEAGAVAIQHLMDMLVTTKAKGSVFPELSYLELMKEGRSENATWSLIYYLGIVTFHKDQGHLTIPNHCMYWMICRRIGAYLNGDPGFSGKMLKSYHDFLGGKTTLFVQLLEEFFRQRPNRSLADASEANLEMAIELLWFEETQCVPQMHLVADPNKRSGEGRSAFVDMFVGNSRRHTVTKPVLVMELKNVSLRSLWKARQPQPNTEPNSSNAYNYILEELRQATEDQLLSQKYTYYDGEQRRWFTPQVREILQTGTTQLSKYMEMIASGRATPTRAGVLDHRVSCFDGQDVLRGYVIVCVGGVRVICRHTGEMATQYSYETTGPRQDA